MRPHVDNNFSYTYREYVAHGKHSYTNENRNVLYQAPTRVLCDATSAWNHDVQRKICWHSVPSGLACTLAETRKEAHQAPKEPQALDGRVQASGRGDEEVQVRTCLQTRRPREGNSRAPAPGTRRPKLLFGSSSGSCLHLETEPFEVRCYVHGHCRKNFLLIPIWIVMCTAPIPSEYVKTVMLFFLKKQ